MSKAIIPTAKEINEAHQFAKEHVETALEWAVKCGQLLARKKNDLGHGKFVAWVEEWCEFSDRQARRYMEVAAKTDTRVRFESMRQALEYGKPDPKPKAPPAKPEPAAKQPPKPEQLKAATTTSKPAEDEPSRPDWEPDADAVLEETERQIAASTDKVMQADDKLAAAHEEIKRQAAEISVLKLSRDAAMNARAAAIKQLQAEQRKVARLEKQVAKLQ